MAKYHLDFVAVGPFKTATSWIYAYLNSHKQVCVPTKVKETFFFDKRPEKSIDWYFSHFSNLGEDKLVGEVAPSYFHSTEAANRIYKLNPQCKIIVTLREPLDRLISFYLHMLVNGDIAKETSFREALQTQKVLTESSKYYQHLFRWISLFGKDNVSILFYESLKDCPQKFADELCRQLGIKLIEIPEPLNRRISAAEVPVSYTLSKIVSKATRFFRYYDLHIIVNFSKRLGLKNLLFKKDTIVFSPSTQDLEYAWNLIKEDIKMLETVLGLDLSFWQDSWKDKGILNFR